MQQKVSDFLEVFQDVNKTAILLLLIALGAIFRMKGYIQGVEFVDLLKTTTISYFGTASVVHLTGMVKDHLESKAHAAELAREP